MIFFLNTNRYFLLTTHYLKYTAEQFSTALKGVYDLKGLIACEIDASNCVEHGGKGGAILVLVTTDKTGIETKLCLKADTLDAAAEWKAALDPIIKF